MLTQDDTLPSPASDTPPPAADSTPAPASEPSAEPSPAPAPTEPAKPETLLDAVRSAVQSPDEDATPTPAEDATAPAADTDTPDPSSPSSEAELTPADLADIKKPSVRKRLETLLEQRHTARREVEALRPDAEAWQATRDFLTEKRIAPDDYNKLLGIGALMAAGDYAAVLPVVEAYYHALQTATGQRLPPDVQQRVDDGLMAEDSARELVQARTAAANARAFAQQAEQRSVTQQQQHHATAVMSAVTTWEDGIKARDPDYAHKADAVLRVARGMAAERGGPVSPDVAVQLAAQAYAEINRVFGAARPAPQPTRPSPTSAAVPSQATQTPNSLREAIMAAARRGASA